MPETFTCVVCGASGAGTLSKHMQTHTAKPHQCTQCNKRYKAKGDLNRHMRVHTNEKPYKCDECDKAFRQSSVLSDHKRGHTGEKPYKCDQCDKAFRQSNSLTKHKKLHINPESRTCSKCGEFFARPTLLINHMLTHSNKKSYKCDECNLLFTKVGNLKRHKRTQHKNQSTTPSISVEHYDSRKGPVTTVTHHSPDSNTRFSYVNSDSGTAMVVESPAPEGNIVTVHQSPKKKTSNHPSSGSDTDTVTEYVPSNPEDATVVTPEENRATMNPGTPGFSFNDLPEHLSPPEDPDEELDTDKLFPDSLFPDSPLSGNPCEHDPFSDELGFNDPLWDELLKDPF